MIPELSILLTRLVRVENEIATLQYGDFTPDDKRRHNKLKEESQLIVAEICRLWEGQKDLT